MSSRSIPHTQNSSNRPRYNWRNESSAHGVASAIFNAGSLRWFAMSVLSSKLRQGPVAQSKPQLKGWLPVDAVVVDGRPGLWWMDMSDVSLTEPFSSKQSNARKRTSNAASSSLSLTFCCNSKKRSTAFRPRVSFSLLTLRLDARLQRLQSCHRLDRDF